jgi:hypothetical protein
LKFWDLSISSMLCAVAESSSIRSTRMVCPFLGVTVQLCGTRYISIYERSMKAFFGQPESIKATKI